MMPVYPAFARESDLDFTEINPSGLAIRVAGNSAAEERSGNARWRRKRNGPTQAIPLQGNRFAHPRQAARCVPVQGNAIACGQKARFVPRVVVVCASIRGNEPIPLGVETKGAGSASGPEYPEPIAQDIKAVISPAGK